MRSMPSKRCGCSVVSQNTARVLDEYASEPTSRCAVPPSSHGASGSSTQSHWVSSPAGCSISIVGTRPPATCTPDMPAGAAGPAAGG